MQLAWSLGSSENTLLKSSVSSSGILKDCQELNSSQIVKNRHSLGCQQQKG